MAAHRYYTTDDNTMCLNMFTFGEPKATTSRTIDDSHPILSLAAKVAVGDVEIEEVDKDMLEPEQIKEYMSKVRNREERSDERRMR